MVNYKWSSRCLNQYLVITQSSIESALVCNLNIFPTLLIVTTGAEHVSLTRLLLPNLPPIENNLPIQPVNFLNRGVNFWSEGRNRRWKRGKFCANLVIALCTLFLLHASPSRSLLPKSKHWWFLVVNNAERANNEIICDTTHRSNKLGQNFHFTFVLWSTD